MLAASALAIGMLLHSSRAGTGAHAATSGPKPTAHSPARTSKRHATRTSKRHATKPTRGGRSAAANGAQKRIRTGRQLLESGKVSASAAAESDLLAGAVDTRLLLVIKAIANLEPVDVLGFADPGPGASTPFRQMTLAETDPAASVSPPVYLQQMIALLHAHATFPPVRAQPVTLYDGQKVVRVEYSAPSPLGS